MTTSNPTETRQSAFDEMPATVRAPLVAARAAYRAAEYVAAEEQNRVALRAAEECDHRLGRILGHRYLGVCLYRRGQLERSEVALRAGLALAREHGYVEQSLFFLNHLGATLRRSGHVEKALSMFEEALVEAEQAGHREARARLLGNLGALYSELGQSAAAADCYARYEEAFESLQDRHRLANARGLVGDQARRRGDHATARRKFDDELRLGEQLGDPTRIVSALLHQAKLAATAEEGRHDDAMRLFAEAASKARAIGETQRLVEVLVPYAEFARKSSRLREANELLDEADRVKLAEDQPELQARIRDARAHLCRDAGLHGEALFHQSKAMTHRLTMYRPLAQPRVRQMAKARMHELSGLLRDLIAEAGRVVRDESERLQLLELVEQVDEMCEKPVDRSLTTNERWKRRMSEPGQPLWLWQDGVREEATRLWSERLLPSTFAMFSRATRSDLLRSTLVYHAVIDDLGRSVHLMARSIERELRERLIEPIRQAYGAHAPVPKGSRVHKAAKEGCSGLGSMLKVVEELAKPLPGNVSAGDILRQVQPRVTHCQRELSALRRLRDPIAPLDGPSVSLVDIRNAVAHGDDAAEAAVDRLQVDAIRRVLVLDTPGILAGIAAISLK